jgi:hypothetical protein
MPFRSGKTIASLLCAFCLLISFTSQASAAALTPLNDDTEFVKQVYQDFLNRAPDAEGLVYWAGEISSGNITRTQMVEQYLVSAEFGETISPVVRLYFTYYLRLPDYDGLMFWVNSYAAGMSLNDISEAFARAQEFIDQYGSVTNEEFVRQMYINVYGRQPDSDGLSYWTGMLDTAALTRGQVMVEFSSAKEYLSISVNQVYVTMTYVGLLRRVPDQNGFDHWVEVMDQGVSGLGLIDSFLVSEEYVARDDIAGTPSGDESIDGYLEAAFAAWTETEQVIDPYTGETDIVTDKFLSTLDNFEAAKALIGVDTEATQSEIDQARFFGAIAGLAKMADPYSDMTDNGLTNLGDVLDAFGVDVSLRQTFGTIHIEDCTIDQVSFEEVCTIVSFDPNSPTSGEILNALRTNMTTRLEGVVDGLSQVSTSFNCRHILGGDITETEFDNADVLFIKGIAQIMIAQLDILMAYDLDVDIDNENKLANDDIWGNDGHEVFMPRNPNFGSLSTGYAGYLTSAKSRLFLAIDAIKAAMESVDQEIGDDYASPVDNQTDEFISFYEESCIWDATYTYCTSGYDPVMTFQAVNETLADLADFESALTSAITIDNDTPYDPTDDFSANLFKIFDGIDLRDQMPTYNPTTEKYGLFPDATLGGVLDPAQFNINEDLDNDGLSDELYGYTHFFEALIFPGGTSQSQTSSYLYWPNGYADEQFVFSDDGTLSYSWSMYDYMTSTSSELAFTQGTWTIDTVSGDLIIEFVVPVASWRDAGTMDEIQINLIMGEDGDGLDVEENHLLGGVPVMYGAVSGSWWLYTVLP